VLTPLETSGAALHVVSIGRPANLDHDRGVVLDRGTKGSGGRYDTILLGTALTARMKEIARELNSQYLVTYARPKTLIPPERITVAAATPSHAVRLNERVATNAVPTNARPSHTASMRVR